MALQEVKLPDIGEGVTEGELVKWLVQVGESVAADQPVAEVLTDKATVEIPTPFPGVVKEFLRKEGDIVPIETGLLRLETGGVSIQASVSSTVQPKVENLTKAEAAPSSGEMMTLSDHRTSHPLSDNRAERSVGSSGAMASTEVYPPAAEFRTLATPGTRRLARESALDINHIKGSGPLGRVTREDVIRAKDVSVSGGAGATSAGRPQMAEFASIPHLHQPHYSRGSEKGTVEERVALRGIRKKIAENLQLAKKIVPHFTLMEEVNVTALVALRSQAKAAGERAGVKITYLPFVMKALIATIRQFPMFNASIDDQASEVVYKKYFNLGFAADTPNGLLVPVIKNADQKTIIDLSREINELAMQARDGKLALENMKGATITITNIGSVGGVYATPIINHPEVAILGMYKITDRPLWENNQWIPAKMMNFTITCDHRLIDGAVAANFMRSFAALMENPAQLMLEMI